MGKVQLRGITTAFFDMGGTLTYCPTPNEERHRRAFARAGVTVSLESLRATLPDMRRWQGPNRENYGWTQDSRDAFYSDSFAHLARLVQAPGDAAQIGRRMWETWEDDYALYPDTRPALEGLQARGLKLGVISNWDKTDLADKLKDLGLAHFFRFILPSAMADADKPAPKIFLDALAGIGSSPSEAIHVGDSYGADVVGAAGVGITGILVARDAQEAPDGCLVVKRLDEILDYLP